MIDNCTSGTIAFPLYRDFPGGAYNFHAGPLYKYLGSNNVFETKGKSLSAPDSSTKVGLRIVEKRKATNGDYSKLKVNGKGKFNNIETDGM